MEDISPTVVLLWRLINFLETDEAEWDNRRKIIKDVQTSNMIHGNYFVDTNDKIRNNINDGGSRTITDLQKGDYNTDADNMHSLCSGNHADNMHNLFSSNHQTNLIQQKSFQNLKKMSSLKRYPAPSPPTQRVSIPPFSKLISTSDILPEDQKGWLIDQLRGRRVWCAVSKNHLCVFEDVTSQTSKQVISIRGCHVRILEFKSADQEGKILNGVARHFVSKPANGVNKFQFILENPVNKQKYMFGTSTKSELNEWTNAIDLASSLNTGSHPTAGNTMDTPFYELETKIRRSSSETRISSLESTSEAYMSPQHMPLFLTNHTSYFPATSPNDTIDGDLRKSLVNEQNCAQTKAIPMKVIRSQVDVSLTKYENSEQKSRLPFKMRPPFEALFRKGKRSASAEDAQHRGRLYKYITDTRLTDDQTSFTSKLNFNQSLSPQKVSSTVNFDRTQNSIDTDEHMLSVRSSEFQKNSKSKRLSLSRVASDLKYKFFKQSSTCKSAGIKLRDLKDIHTSGCLRYRKDGRFYKMHCVLSRGCFYAFRSDKGDEIADLCFALNQCNVNYIPEAEERTESLFAFKVNKSNCESICLCADDHGTMMKWMMAMQFQSSKVMVDDDSLQDQLQDSGFSLETKLSNDKEENKSSFLQVEPNTTKLDQHSRSNNKELNPLLPESLDDKYQQKDEKSWNNSNELNNNLTNRSEPDVNIYKSINIYHPNNLTLQSKNLATVNMQRSDFKAQTTSTIHDNLHVQLSPEGYGTGGSGAVVSRTFLPSIEPATSHEDTVSTDFTKSHHFRTQSVHFVNMPPLSDQVHSTVTPCFKRTSSVGKHQFIRNCTEDMRMTSFGSALTFTDHLDAPEKDGQFSSRDYHTDILSSDLNLTYPNQDYSKSNINYPIHKLFDINSNKAELESFQKQYRFDSSIHDDALKESWSTSEDLLMEVVKEKLRRRHLRQTAEVQNKNIREEVCIVNDEWNITSETQQVGLSVNVAPDMNTGPSAAVLIGYNMTDSCQVPVFDKPEQTYDWKSHDKGRYKEGTMERWTFDEQWQRYWCVLCDGCLCCYLTPEDKLPQEIIELAGYIITLTTDQFQEKQFVLNLTHVSNMKIILSVEGLEECTNWYKAFQATLSDLDKTTGQQETTKIQADKSETNEDKKQNPSAETVKQKLSSAETVKQKLSSAETVKQKLSSAETVKQKLLAEVLRQKLELEKMQAARTGPKTETQTVGKSRSTSPTFGTAPVTDDDKTCMLTRLTQRRMSTQIKLSAVQKQMKASSYSSKDKKIVFPLGKKKPDLVQGHSENGCQRPELREQARLLSSQLHELDSCLLAHGAGSPKLQSKTRIRSLRHSYDQASLKNLQLAAEASRDIFHGTDGEQKLKDQEKLREVNRSSSLKTSVQKFAHKTLAKANWYLNKKSANQTDEKSKQFHPSYATSLSDSTPDIIDVTQTNRTFYAFDGPDIHDSCGTLRNEYALTNRTMPGHHNNVVSNDILQNSTSKLSSSPSLTNINRFNGRMTTSISSPSLSKLQVKPEKETLFNIAVMSRLAEGDFHDDTVLRSPISARDQGSSGSLPPKRQVSANVLAEIEAFEELSMKILGTDSISK